MSVLWPALGRLYHGLATAAGYGIVAAIATGLVYDVSLRMNSLEVQGQVQLLATLSEEAEVFAGPETEQDFDGDGVLDRVALIDHKVQGAFLGYTTTLLCVYSGRTGEVLFARQIFLPHSFKGWCADYDGNGTVELQLESRRDFHVFGVVMGAP